MKKLMGIVALLLIVIAVVFWAVELKPKNIDEKTIRVGYNAESFNQAPLIVAFEKNIFAEHGIKVELSPMKGGKEIKQAISTGKLDIGLGGASNFIPLISQGAPMKLLAPINESPSYIYVRPDTIKTLKELEGKTIGSNPGGASEIFIKDTLKKENVDIEKITFDASDTSLYAIGLLEKKNLDAVIEDEQSYDKFTKAGAIVLPEWKDKGYAGPRTPRSVIVANTDFLSRNEKLASAFLDSIIDAHKYISASKSEAANVVADHCTKAGKGAFVATKEDVLRLWSEDKNRFYLWLDPEVYVGVANQLREIGEVKKELKAEDIFDMRFKDKLMKAQNKIY